MGQFSKPGQPLLQKLAFSLKVYRALVKDGCHGEIGRSVLGVHWKDWCWSWNSNNWPPDAKNRLTGKDSDAGKIEGGREGDDRRWDGWMASPMRWTRVWVGSGNWWWTGRPGVLQCMGPQSVRQSWVTELKTVFINYSGFIYEAAMKKSVTIWPYLRTLTT